jgi:hypothetical protein
LNVANIAKGTAFWTVLLNMAPFETVLRRAQQATPKNTRLGHDRRYDDAVRAGMLRLAASFVPREPMVAIPRPSAATAPPVAPAPNCLRRLGLGGDASGAMVRRAFRQKALMLHPDCGGDARAFAALVSDYERALVFTQAGPRDT